MSQELAPVDSWIDVIGPVGDLASRLARTQFVPRAMQGNPAAVAAAILTGRELALGPMTSLRGIDVIEGRPALSAQMIAARILNAGHRITWTTSTDQRATVKIERGDGLSEAEATWTIQDATRAGLAGRKVWQQYPRAMLRHRALTEAAAMACPDVILGLDTGDIEPAEPRPSTGATVVQVRTEPHVAAEIMGNPDTPIHAETPDTGTTDMEPPTVANHMALQAELVEELVTPAQLRKINAMLGDWETSEGRRLDRDERRRLIGFMAGVPDPDTLTSAKELTRQQASEAIDQLQQALNSQEKSDEQPG